MKYKTLITSTIFALLASTAVAQTTPTTAKPSSASGTGGATTLTARVGTDSAAYNFAEVIHEYDNGLLTGAGWTSSDTPDNNREVYGGAGAAFDLLGVKVLAIAFVDQTAGKETDAQTSLVPWLVATRKVGSVISTANYFAYTPIGDGAETLHVLEHAKAEYDFGRYRAGAGYAATKSGDAPWQHKPFVSVTRETRIGAFEVWAQRPAEGQSTFQLRYSRTF